ncbi:MAG: hypothetical protein PWQ06_123 [Anaerophaga sp.]|jgi:hypothetical protein|nr:hypothetical protein [Anaerophaga sp.]
MKMIVTYADYKNYFDGAAKENYNEEAKTITVTASEIGLISYLKSKGISQNTALGVAHFAIKAGLQTLKVNIKKQPESADKAEVLKAIELIKEV